MLAEWVENKEWSWYIISLYTDIYRDKWWVYSRYLDNLEYISSLRLFTYCPYIRLYVIWYPVCAPMIATITNGSNHPTNPHYHLAVSPHLKLRRTTCPAGQSVRTWGSKGFMSSNHGRTTQGEKVLKCHHPPCGPKKYDLFFRGVSFLKESNDKLPEEIGGIGGGIPMKCLMIKGGISVTVWFQLVKWCQVVFTSLGKGDGQ